MRAAHCFAIAALGAVLAGCVVVPERQHALVLQSDGTVVQRTLRCEDPPEAGPARADALDPALIRTASWNLHKESDSGWESDLGRLIAQSDVLLLQEAGVSPELRRVVEREGRSWMLSSAFEYQGSEYGVLTATRVSPISACTLRANEPLLGIPKAALVTRYSLKGRDDTLAVVNVHAINFTFGTGEYAAQLEAAAEALRNHRGPIIFAGDFNTWNDERSAVVHSIATRLSLSPVRFAVDERTRFMGERIFDWIYSRGLEVVAASAWPVSSSDHNPVTASFRVP
jgi:endonuclease/exonuclease/phosphatase (EEP) superfamily protein YafD